MSEYQVLDLDADDTSDSPCDNSPLTSPSPQSSPDLAVLESPPDVTPDDPAVQKKGGKKSAAGGKKPAGGASGKRAEIWNEYEEPEFKDGKEKVKCKQCPTYLCGDPSQGTSHLMKHKSRCKGRKVKDIRQLVLQANFNKEKFELSPYNFDQDASRKELSKMIILHEYPLKMVEHEGFKNFVKSINPCFKLVTRNTVKSDCLKMYELLKKDVMQSFDTNESRVAITTDMWTASHQNKGFMVVTAHYIDNDWKLQSRIIRFIYVPSPHTSKVLSKKLMECLHDWNIDRKISTITIDNCTTNDAMIDLLLEKLPYDSMLLGGKLLQFRCCAHIVNLIVKEGLEVIKVAIEKVRESVAYWSGTPKRWEKFEASAGQQRIPIGKKLALDCKTRWNSTYLMLETALEYKDVFARLKNRETKYKSPPSEDDWILTKEICSRLKVFYKATELFSGTKYPTTNLCFPKICEIKLAMTEWLDCGINVVQLMASKMITKFEKYWSDVHGIMGVAAVLDPRYKLILLDFYFPKNFGTNGEYEVDKVLNLCRDLLKQYEVKEKVNETSNPSGLMECDDTNDPLLSDFDLYAAQRKRKSTRSELDLYLDEDVLPRTSDFDVLTWWKSNRGKYPILHQIARDVLAIPVSTVASESTFSTSGRLISPHRSRLHHNTVEALMCSQNWLLAEKVGAFGACATISYDSDDEDNAIKLGVQGVTLGKSI